jgi:hypothetical protein
MKERLKRRASERLDEEMQKNAMRTLARQREQDSCERI